MEMDSSRRTFLFAVGGGAPLILGAANKSGSDKPILGEGDHKYEVTHDWGQLPANIKYGNTHGVFEDSQGHSYVHQYNSKGDYIRTFGGGGGKEAGQLNCPHGIIVDTRGKSAILAIADRGNNRIQNFTLDGKHIDFAGGTNMPCHFSFNRKNG